MSRTLWIILFVAAICIIFVVYKFIGVEASKITETGSSTQTASGTPSEFSSWVQFEPPSHKFTASFPSPPQHISQNTPDAFNRFVKHYEIYGSEGIDRSGFMIQAITYSNGSDPADDKNILENTLSDFLATSSVNRLVSSEKTTFHGQKALKFEIDSNRKRISGIIFVENKTLFVLSRIVPMEDKDEMKDFKYFIDTFTASKDNLAVPKPETVNIKG